jgi:hypothetical protein
MLKKMTNCIFSCFSFQVRNCVAHDGKRTPIQLVNELGCIIRPKIMSKFQKIKNFGASATVVSYAYFQAFKFPDSMNVHFQCVIQVCRYNCPDPVCPDDATSSTNRWKKNPDKTFNSLSIYELEYSSSVTNYAEKSNKRSTVLLLRLVRFPA